MKKYLGEEQDDSQLWLPLDYSEADELPEEEWPEDGYCHRATCLGKKCKARRCGARWDD